MKINLNLSKVENTIVRLNFLSKIPTDDRVSFLMRLSL